MTQEQALQLVRVELTRAQALHSKFHSGHEGFAVIREELDELWETVKANKEYVAYKGSTAREAVQVAAMAIRFLIDLCDRDVMVDAPGGFYYSDPVRESRGATDRIIGAK